VGAKVLQMKHFNEMRQQIKEATGEVPEVQVKKLFEDCLALFQKGSSCSQIAWQLRRSAKDSFYSYLAQALEVCQRRLLSYHERNHLIYLNLNLAAAVLEPEDSEQRLLYRQVYELAENEVDIFS